jgi:hypothetical protein
MAFERTKLIASFAFLGFLIGAGGYHFINWFALNSGYSIPPIAEIFFSPWFVSGFAGSLLAVLVVVVFSSLANRE